MRGFIAELSNGQVVLEDKVMTDLHSFILENSLQNERPWTILKKYVKANNIRLMNVTLQYDHQKVFFPRGAKAYFFSGKVEAFLGGSGSQRLYYGVGAATRHDQVEITWYDGDNSVIENRKIDAENPAFIVN